MNKITAILVFYFFVGISFVHAQVFSDFMQDPNLQQLSQQPQGLTAEQLSTQSGLDPSLVVESDEKTEIESTPPFGSKLFTGNFLKGRGDGVNPGYLIQPGDKVNVAAWGALTLNEIFTVDTQGNIFIPGIGPMGLEGVRNSDLTRVVKTHVGKVYTDNFDVYTNLVTAQPIAVYVTGLVTNPGRYNGIASDSILYFLDLAGGIDPQLGSYRNVEILRKGKKIASIDLYDFLLEGKLAFQQLKENDTILVKHRGSVVKLDGDVARSSLVELKKSEAKGSEVLQVIPKAAKATGVTLGGIRGETPIQKTMSLLEFLDFTVHDGDVITLRDDGRADSILINITGDFDGPTTLSVKNGARLVDVLNHIPIDPNLANVQAVHIRRLSVAAAQQDAINDSLFRLERSTMLALSGSTGEVAIRRQEAELVSDFAKRARLIEPLGRVVTSQDGVQQNILLEAEDTIVIPTKTQIVKTAGEVLMMSAVVHHKDWRVEDYIEKSGGFSVRANQDRIIIHRPNADVTIGGIDSEVQPGDEIMVLPEIDSKTQQFAKDIVDIIFKLAVVGNAIF